MLVNGWDLLVLNDGTALLLLYGEGRGDLTPEAVPIGPLPATEARRVADWLCRSAPMDMEQVWRHMERVDGDCVTTR